MVTSMSFAPKHETVEQGSARRWLALVAIALGQLMLALDATIMNVALPTVERSLGFSLAVRPWVVSAYLLPFALLLLPGGRLADALGQKRSFLIGALGFAPGSALGGAAEHYVTLLLARALQGAFAALLAPSALALVAVCFREPRERARAFGIYGAVAACGGALGLLLGGGLAGFADWRWCLYVNVGFATVALAGVGIALEPPPRPPARAGWWRSLAGLLGDPRRRTTLAVAALSVAAMSGLFLLMTYSSLSASASNAAAVGQGWALATGAGLLVIAALCAVRLGVTRAPGTSTR